MKVSVFPTLLAFIASAAIGYLAYDMAHADTDPNEFVVGIGTGLSSLLTLGCVLGISLKENRININMKAWSIASFIILTAINISFAGFGVSMPYYVIVIVLLLVVHIWVVYKLAL